MLSTKLRNLAAVLQHRPELAVTIAANLAELADCVAHIEHAEVPQHFIAELPAGVVRLDQRRTVRA